MVSLTKDPMDPTLFKKKINNGLKLLNCPLDERKMKYFKIDQYPKSILSYLTKDDMVYMKNLNQILRQYNPNQADILYVVNMVNQVVTNIGDHKGHLKNEKNKTIFRSEFYNDKIID